MLLLGAMCETQTQGQISDPSGFFNLGTIQVLIPSGSSYQTDTLGKVCSLAETGSFGGWIHHAFPATGFFHTQLADGAWCIIDPEGYEFIAMSVVSVEKGGGISLPSALKRYSINSMGNWSDLTIPDIPYCPRFNFLQGFKNTDPALKELFNRDILPVFEPGFEVYCDLQAALFVKPFLKDPWVIGYFTDNELNFHRAKLDDYLGLDTGNANYLAARSWIEQRQGTDPVITDEDRDAFRGHIVSTYAEKVFTAVKKHDPDHMILGPRLHASGKYNPYILRGIGPYVDILGINFYSRWEPYEESMDQWLEESGKPFLITEFYTKAEDTGLPNTTGAGWKVYTQQDRAWFFENFTLALLSHPGSVGWQWFRYMDKDGVNRGILSTDYTWYEELLESMHKIGRDVYNLRRFLLGMSYDPQPDPACGMSITLERNHAAGNCTIFPDPSESSVQVFLKSPVPQDLQVSMFNVRAEKVFQQRFNSVQAGTEIKIHGRSHGLDPGFYLIRIDGGNWIQREKLILF